MGWQRGACVPLPAGYSQDKSSGECGGQGLTLVGNSQIQSLQACGCNVTRVKHSLVLADKLTWHLICLHTSAPPLPPLTLSSVPNILQSSWSCSVWSGQLWIVQVYHCYKVSESDFQSFVFRLNQSLLDNNHARKSWEDRLTSPVDTELLCYQSMKLQEKC